MIQVLEKQSRCFCSFSAPYKNYFFFSNTTNCISQGLYYCLFWLIFPYKNPSYRHKYLSADSKWCAHRIFNFSQIKRWRYTISCWIDEIFFCKISFCPKAERWWFFALKLRDVIKFIGRLSKFSRKHTKKVTGILAFLF